MLGEPKREKVNPWCFYEPTEYPKNPEFTLGRLSLGTGHQEERDAVYRRLEINCDQDSWGQHELLDVIQQSSGANRASRQGAAEGGSDRTAMDFTLQSVAGWRSKPPVVPIKIRRNSLYLRQQTNGGIESLLGNAQIEIRELRPDSRTEDANRR
jgi:hypothetical protein